MQEFRLLHLIEEHPVEVFLVVGIVLVIGLMLVSHWMFKFVEAREKRAEQPPKEEANDKRRK